MEIIAKEEIEIIKSKDKFFIKPNIRKLTFISMIFLHFLLSNCDEVTKTGEVKAVPKIRNRTEFSKKDSLMKKDSPIIIMEREVIEYEAVLPLKLNKNIVEGLLRNSDFQSINTVLLGKLLKIIEPLPSIQLTPQEKSVNYERLHPNEEEKPEEVHFSKSYLQRANLDADSEKEILLYIGRNADDRGDVLLIDKKENEYYIINKIEKEVRASRETQEPFFQINEDNRVFTINHNISWGGGMLISDEYITSFYKVMNNEVKNCLNISHESWAIDSFESKLYSLSSKYFFKGKDTIQVAYDYEFSICSIELLLEKYPKLKNTSIAKEEQILMFKDRDTVNYVWKNEINKYEAVFLPHNKLNQTKLYSLSTESEISYLETFQKEFESIKLKGNKIQKLFLKQIPDFYDTK